MPYFDHNATTPLCPPARQAWLRVQETLWHNASSLYREAAAARDELEHCRERLAEMLGEPHPEAVVFTSGATEGCNGFFRVYAEWIRTHPDTPWRTLISPYEHPAVREPAARLCGAEEVDRATLEHLLEGGLETTRCLLVAWMAANNETGEIFPWRNWIGPESGEKTPRFFCDAAQWFGKLPAEEFRRISLRPALAGSAHKFGGPKGVGFFRVSAPGGGDHHWAWQFGGPQENRVRAGTEDVAGVAAMVAALEWSEEQMPGDPRPRDEFEATLGWPVVAGDRPRLWNTSMLVAPRHDNRLWLARLSQRGFQCSTGSACSSGKDGDSHVLAAMGLPPDAMKRVLRFSSGWTTMAAEWRALAAALRDVLTELDRRSVHKPVISNQ